MSEPNDLTVDAMPEDDVSLQQTHPIHITAVSERQPRMPEDESNGQYQSRAFNRSDAQSMMG